MQSKASSQDSLIQSKLVRQLLQYILTQLQQHLDRQYFCCACWQTRFQTDSGYDLVLVYMLSALSNSYSQHRDCLQQERVTAINSPFEQHLGCHEWLCYTDWTFCFNLLPECRQLWIVHIKCIHWIYPALFSSAEGTLPPACCCLRCHHGAAKPSIPALWQVCSALALEKKV